MLKGSLVGMFLWASVLTGFFLRSSALASWQTVKQWSGSGIMTTETFSVASSEWRISWKVEATNPISASGMLVTVYTPGKRRTVATAMQQGIGSGTSYVHEGPGRYYLEITAFYVSSWTVKIEDQRPD